MRSHFSSLPGRNKWRIEKDKFVPGQLVLLGDAEDTAHKGAYRFGRIHCLHPQIQKRKEIVRKATVTVVAQKNSSSDSCKIKYVLGDNSKIAPT